MKPEVTTIDREAWVIVYLAGGMKSDWQDKVIEACKHRRIQFLDPRTHDLTNEEDYTGWDLWAVNQADFVFAYLEKDNPGGQGLMIELGHGYGGTKKLIFVEDENDPRTRYYGMARVISDWSFVGFDEALAWFQRTLKLYTA